MFAKLIDEKNVCIFIPRTLMHEGRAYENPNESQLKRVGFLPLDTSRVPEGYKGALRYTEAFGAIVASPLL